MLLFYKLKARSTTNKRMTSFIAVAWNQTCGIAQVCLRCFSLSRLLQQNASDWAAYKQYIYVRVLQPGKVEIKAPADSVSNESPIPGSRMTVF